MADFWNPWNENQSNFTDASGPSATVSFGEDTLANNGLVISFTHVPTDNTVHFKAFVTAYNETFSSDWSSEVVYGRADPIYLFKNTTRKISLAFKVPAVSTSEAYDNLGKVQLLAQFLYPTYKEGGLAQTITQSPLVRLKMMNLGGDASGITAGSYDSYKDSGNGSTGLLGAVTSVTINHNLDTDVGVVTIGDGVILPKLIEVNVEFSPIHEHHLGWDENNQFGIGLSGENEGSAFPYGIGATVPGADAATSVEADQNGQNDAEEPTNLEAGPTDVPTPEPDTTEKERPAGEDSSGDSDAADQVEAAVEVTTSTAKTASSTGGGGGSAGTDEVAEWVSSIISGTPEAPAQVPINAFGGFTGASTSQTAIANAVSNAAEDALGGCDPTTESCVLFD